MPSANDSASPFDEIRNHPTFPQKGQGMDGFDAIMAATYGDDPSIIDDYAKNGGRFSNERHPQMGNLTQALFLAKTSTALVFQAFHDHGGVFTDQTDDRDKNAGAIISERWIEAFAQLMEATEETKRAEWRESLWILGDTLSVYFSCVRAQGGLVHVEESAGPLRPPPAQTLPEAAP